MSEFYCCKCGRRGIPILRKKGAEREAGHLKRLWCINCQQEWNHVECKPWTKYTVEDFEIEFKTGNFDEQGNRKMPYGKLKGMIHNGEINVDDRDSGCR